MVLGNGCFWMFVNGVIICIYEKGKNEGIDILVVLGSMILVVGLGMVVVIICDVD